MSPSSGKDYTDRLKVKLSELFWRRPRLCDGAAAMAVGVMTARQLLVWWSYAPFIFLSSTKVEVDGNGVVEVMVRCPRRPRRWGRGAGGAAGLPCSPRPSRRSAVRYYPDVSWRGEMWRDRASRGTGAVLGRDGCRAHGGDQRR